tara:strand:- start:285 stop:1535 length:1251 start_codon:yes stop_codon:yes gene_type:complete
LNYINVDESLRVLLNSFENISSSQLIPSSESYRRVLFNDIYSSHDVPFYDKSHFDGYAVNSSDTENASSDSPLLLKVIDSAELTDNSPLSLQLGNSMKIRTGAFVPYGSNSIIPKENVKVVDDYIELTSPINSGHGIVPRGSDLKSGTIIVKKGSIIRSQDLSLFRLLRIPDVAVYSKPSVGIISVGSELSDNLKEATSGKITRSHDFMVHQLISDLGAIPKDHGIVHDDIELIKKKLSSLLSGSSIILTIGGSSVGESDLVSQAIQELGDPGMIVHGLQLQPGRVAGFGCISGTPIILLPGLIQSTINAFIFLVFPLIRKLIGLPADRKDWSLYATLSDSVTFTSFTNFKHVTWIRLKRVNNKLIATPVIGDSSMLNVFLQSHGYLLTDSNVTQIKSGTLVEVNQIRGMIGSPFD